MLRLTLLLSVANLFCLIQLQLVDSFDKFPVDAFIISLINQTRLSQCSLMILCDSKAPEDSLDRIAFSSKKPSYSVQVLNETSDLNVSFPMRNVNYRQRSDPCLILVLMTDSVQPTYMQKLFSLLTPVYIPISRKDEDFYIFYTKPSLHKKMLMMKEFPNKVKFKIAVGKESESSLVKVSTICFFCQPGGMPTFVRFPLSGGTMPLLGTNYFPDFVWNLNGKLLHVSYPLVAAKIQADRPWQRSGNAKRGHWKTLFEEFLTVKVKFNFTYHVFASTGKGGNIGGGGTGLRLQNGTWIGVAGDVLYNKAQLGIVMARTPERVQYIDFTDSFYDDAVLTFATAKPSKVFSPVALLWPFDVTMWFAIGLCPLICIAFFRLVTCASRNVKYGEVKKWTLGDQVRFLLSTFLEQDSPRCPESQGLRCFLALWILFTMVITTVYRSKMTTPLAFPVLGKIPQTFEELAFSDYKVGFIKHGDSAYNTLAGSTDPVYVKLVKEMEVFKGHGLECLEKVVKYKYACIGYDSAMMFLRERNLSESDTKKIVFARARTYHVWLGLALEGRSIYKKNLGQILSYTRPFHLENIWLENDMYYNVRKCKFRWWQDTNQTDKAKHLKEDLEDLTLKHFAGAFYVLIACLITSAMFFIQEVMSVHSRASWLQLQFGLQRFLRLMKSFNRNLHDLG